MGEQSSADVGFLDKECIALCDYLVGQKASEYICRQYREAHYRTNLVRQSNTNSFDHFIVNFGQRGKLCARMADVYTRWFYRRSALRSKLLLLMAILECSKSTYNFFEMSQTRSKAFVWFKLLINGIGWSLCLVTSLVFFSCSYPVVKCTNRIKKTSKAK